MAEELSGPHVGYLGLLRRIASHWRLSLIVCVGVAAPVAVWALLFLPKSYEAVAAIFIEDPRRGSVSTLRDWMPAGDASYQQAVLRSRSLAAAVVDNLPQDSMNELIRHAMHRDYVLAGQNLIRRLLGHEPVVFSPQQRAVRELLTARIRFESLPSGEVEIRAIAYHPQVAKDLANTYIEVLQSRSRSHIRDEARATRQFIENLLAQTKANLQEAEESLAKHQRGGTLKLPERSSVEMAGRPVGHSADAGPGRSGRGGQTGRRCRGGAGLPAKPRGRPQAEDRPPVEPAIGAGRGGVGDLESPATSGNTPLSLRHAQREAWHRPGPGTGRGSGSPRDRSRHLAVGPQQRASEKDHPPGDSARVRPGRGRGRRHRILRPAHRDRGRRLRRDGASRAGVAANDRRPSADDRCRARAAKPRQWLDPRHAAS